MHTMAALTGALPTRPQTEELPRECMGSQRGWYWDTSRERHLGTAGVPLEVPLGTTGVPLEVPLDTAGVPLEVTQEVLQVCHWKCHWVLQGCH